MCRTAAVLLAACMSLSLTGTARAEPIVMGGSIFLPTHFTTNLPDELSPTLAFLLFKHGANIFGRVHPDTGWFGDSGEVNWGTVDVTRSPTPQPALPGQPYDLSVVLDFRYGVASFEDVGAVSMQVEGRLRFDASPTILGATPGVPGTLIGHAPVAFTGVIRGLSTDGDVLVLREVQGTGTGRVLLSIDDPDSYDYVFGLNPVPEPGTLILLGGAASVLAGRRLRRRPQP